MKTKKKDKIYIFRIFRTILGPIYKWYYNPKIIGKENIPKEGALIFCGNHKSFFDAPAIEITTPRKMRFLAKEELKKFFILHYVCWAFDSIWVKKNSKDISTIKEALKTLKNGGCIGIFPEGTRNGLEKNNGEIKNGAAYLALKTQVKIIPVGITGNGRPFERNKVIYGEPFDLSQYKDRKIDKELENEVNELLITKIFDLIKE